MLTILDCCKFDCGNYRHELLQRSLQVFITCRLHQYCILPQSREGSKELSNHFAISQAPFNLQHLSSDIISSTPFNIQHLSFNIIFTAAFNLQYLSLNIT